LLNSDANGKFNCYLLCIVEGCEVAGVVVRVLLQKDVRWLLYWATLISMKVLIDIRCLWWLEENKRRDGARVRFSAVSFFI